MSVFIPCACAKATAGTNQPAPAQAEFFENNVRPLLAEKCWPCHGTNDKTKGGLRLTSRTNLLKGGDSGPAAIAGQPASSLIIQAITYDQEPKMPPKGKLTGREIEVLSQWVAMGLPWPETRQVAPADKAPERGARPDERQRPFWSFQPVKAVAVPEVRDGARARTAIDRFLLADLEKHLLEPARAANRHTLIRRITFDLIGLPPTPDEIDAFLADSSPGALARVVDRLLASPRYGERSGRHWLDVVRYADARDLIQLPAESDFREAWRYRDWVVSAFNRDLPYPQFLKTQLAGDVMAPPSPGTWSADRLIATGLLAIADFVPGDVDKDQMIADYVNDQIDVVSKAFLGLSVACARCHDHKFDPISTEDYYALAGIFFSTRLIPGPIAGNTPLVRVPLLSPDELKRIQAEDTARKRRLAELEQSLPDAVDRAYVAFLRKVIRSKFAEYLIVACECRQAPPAGHSLEKIARERGIDAKLLKGFVAYLVRASAQPSITRHAIVQSAAAGTLLGHQLAASAAILAKDIAALEAPKPADLAHPPKQPGAASSCLIRLRADDPHLVADREGRVLIWPNRAGLPADARPESPSHGPLKSSTEISGHTRTVLSFDGHASLSFPRRVPVTGSLFVVFRISQTAAPGQRLLGWEDSDTGKHGLGLLAERGGRLHAVLRHNGQAGDLVDTRAGEGFELVCITWGARGATMHRNGKGVGSQIGLNAVSSDPVVAALRLGGPGSGGSPQFQGELAEIRVYNQQLDEAERRSVETELRATWLDPKAPTQSPVDPLSELYDELLSARGPFWLPPDEQKAMLPPQDRSELDAMLRDLDILKKQKPREIPQAVVVQEGGPKGTRHEGFTDAHVFIRGNAKRLGKTVPRGIPHVLIAAGDHPIRITHGSGRRELADWIASTNSPLTARVMVNRIWLQHFGEGLVRTPNDFGERGDRPANPALLDWLAARFVESGWSVKAMHRLILLSSAYQKTSSTTEGDRARDPENRLWGRMNRRRLDAETIRDSLLAVAGRLDATMKGTPFAELAVPRRTLYLQTVRTGATAGAADFGRIFDKADPGSIVGSRGESVVAPQALFFMNDPFVNEMAQALAAMVASDEPGSGAARINRLYALALGRPPSADEQSLGAQLLAGKDDSSAWERYCHLILCQNEFIYID